MCIRDSGLGVELIHILLEFVRRSFRGEVMPQRDLRFSTGRGSRSGRTGGGGRIATGRTACKQTNRHQGRQEDCQCLFHFLRSFQTINIQVSTYNGAWSADGCEEMCIRDRRIADLQAVLDRLDRKIQVYDEKCVAMERLLRRP